MSKLLEALSQSNVFLNLLPLLALAGFVFAVARAATQPLWKEAFRRLRRNKIALVALGVIGVFVTVGLLDSIGWAGKDVNSGQTVARKSVIDRLFEKPQERYYSAPFGRTTVGEPRPRPLEHGPHLLGTDGVGADVFYRTLKGTRTALIIGGLTSLITTPLALIFGMMAGYFGKWRDDAIQYSYTVLDSIPNILLLISLMIVLGKGLPQLCIALGITSWVGLCRLTRGETLKHRERDYVRAAKALGVSNGRILARHILPNLLPLVIIQVTIGLGGLILSEALLSYLQIGVPAETGSWGNMIDAARLELAREPVIWWNLVAASAALFLLVLAFNAVGDALRDAIDPRLRSS